MMTSYLMVRIIVPVRVPAPVRIMQSEIGASPATRWLSVARLVYFTWLVDKEKKDQCFVATLLASGCFGSGLPCEASLSLLCSYSYRHFVNVRAPFLLSRRPNCWPPVDMLEHLQLSVAALATSWKE
jgi:hypothetical protein